jgi:hypothetical protein
MSSAFLLSYSHKASATIQSALLKAWIPFIAHRSVNYQHTNPQGGSVHLYAWSLHEKSARGSYWTIDDTSSTALAYQGWLREPHDASIKISVAEVIEQLCQEGESSALDALHQRPGQFALVYLDPHGRVHALSDAFCGQHLYFAQVSQRVIISNRAVLIAAALDGFAQLDRGYTPHRIQPKRPNAFKLGWHLSRYESPLGDPCSAWSEIKLILPHQRLQVDHNGANLIPISMSAPPVLDWDQLFDDLVWRAGQLARLPDLPLQLPLTGGFDSRLILGSLHCAGVLNQVSRVFIRADPEHVDYVSANIVAEAYGLTLETVSAANAYTQEDGFFNRLRRHNFFIEYMLNAWDLKSFESNLPTPKHASLLGYYGELYRSHADKLRSHLWWSLQHRYLNRQFIDRHRLLTDDAIDYYRAYHEQWFSDRHREHTPPNHVLDEAHREARMWRWASQALQAESICYPSFSLLADVHLRASYAKLSLKERLQPRVHFELMRRVDHQLSWLPFAKHQWPSRWAQEQGHTSPKPVKGAGSELSAQIHMWKRERDEICDFLLAQEIGSPWSDIVNHKKLTNRISLVRSHPSPQHVKGLLGAAGVKFALEKDLVAFQLRD